MRRRLVHGLVVTIVVSQLAAGAAWAKGPSGQASGGGGEPQGDDRVLPLTADQRASRDKKETLIAGLQNANGGGGAVTASCPTPNVATPDGTQPTADATCWTPSKWTLAANARQQEKSYYCGPAVVQVVSNFSWGFTTTNKYSQTTISNTWTKTDATLQTYLGDFINGMNGASRKPSGFAYMQKHDPTFADWHTTIVSGIYNWRMPLAASVRPHEVGATYYIISWPVAKSAAHYIGLFGYEGFASTTNLSRKVYYTDTAGPYAASGVRAGNFWDISYDIWQTMRLNNRNMVY